MHPNPAFRKTSEEQNLAFASRRGFGVLILNGADGPLASHVPFIIRDRRLEAHLVRSNPIIRALSEPRHALMAVSGAVRSGQGPWGGLSGRVWRRIRWEP